MRIYKCWVSSDELFTDSKPKNVQKLEDIGFYKVKGEHISRTHDDIQLAGANASQEEAAEENEAHTETGYDIEIDNHYNDDGVKYDKPKPFAKMVFFDYLNNLKAKLEKEYEGDELEKKLKEYESAKKLVGNFIKKPPVPLDQIDILSAKSYSAEGMYIMKTWEPEMVNGTETDVPYYWYLIFGVEEEKV